MHTYSGYENKVAANLMKTVENRKLHDLILEVRVPVEKVTEIKDNKKKEIERKVFPGYVLVKMAMTDESWYVVRNTRGVTGFVGPGPSPFPSPIRRSRRMALRRRPFRCSTGWATA
jgi:transcriptional antiterminator NusG